MDENKEQTQEAPVTPEGEAQERMNGFLKEYGELVEKYNIDFATYPVFIPQAEGWFGVKVQTTPVDVSNHPQKSPLVVAD